MDLAFVDVETTGLDPRIHKLWSIGIITQDKEYYSEFPVVLDEHTDLEALKINRYVETLAGRDHWPGKWVQTAREVSRILKDKTLVGAAVHFDAAFIKRLLEDFYTAVAFDNTFRQVPWHYKLLDVCTLTMGTKLLGHIPSLSECCEIWDIPVDDSNKHNAFYDAKLARNVYDACMDVKLSP